MLISVQSQGIEKFLIRLEQKLNSPDLIVALGTDLATSLVAEAQFNRPTGATAAALSVVSAPDRTSTGWSIGVGDKSKTGDRNEPAPTGTLRDFFTYLERTGVSIRPTNWWGLPRDLKEQLAVERRGGKFGGRGGGYANYMWVQNYGNSKAGIVGTGFLERGVQRWTERANETVRRYLAET